MSTHFGNAQSPIETFSFQDNSSRIEVKLLVGFWETTDTIKRRIEFVNSDFELKLIIPANHPYYFSIDSLQNVSSSGFYPNWPPYDCELKLITSDTLEIKYSQIGVKPYSEKYLKVKGK